MGSGGLDFTIKICGVTSVSDAELVLGSGADAIGLNFYPRSLRCVDKEIARQISKISRPGKACTVGVFVNQSGDEIRSIATTTGLDWIQLHGDEPLSILNSLPASQVIRVLRMNPDMTVEQMLHYVEPWLQSGTAAVLIDAPIQTRRVDDDDEADRSPSSTKLYGGTGLTVDWSKAQSFVELARVPTILAGGLKPDNVSQAIEATSCFAVDVASGVEGLPGRKDRALVEAFVSIARKSLVAVTARRPEGRDPV